MKTTKELEEYTMSLDFKKGDKVKLNPDLSFIDSQLFTEPLPGAAEISLKSRPFGTIRSISDEAPYYKSVAWFNEFSNGIFLPCLLHVNSAPNYEAY